MKLSIKKNGSQMEFMFLFLICSEFVLTITKKLDRIESMVWQVVIDGLENEDYQVSFCRQRFFMSD